MNNERAPAYWYDLVEFDRLAERLVMLRNAKLHRERSEFDVSADSELPCLLKRQAE